MVLKKKLILQIRYVGIKIGKTLFLPIARTQIVSDFVQKKTVSKTKKQEKLA